MKINKTLYNKLLLQAEEAKNHGMVKLASDVINSIEAFPEEEAKEYSRKEMQDDVSADVWKVATRVFNYYQVKSADIEILNKIIIQSSEQLISNLEKAINLKKDLIGKSEPLVPGEEK